jgi:hypothetical protein
MCTIISSGYATGAVASAQAGEKTTARTAFQWEK